MDISSGVIQVLGAVYGIIAQIWNFVDQIYVLSSVSLLDLFVASFVVSMVLWLAFGFNEDEDEGGDE